MSHRFVKLTNMYKLNKILLKWWVEEEVKAIQSKHGNTVGQNDQIQPESEAHSNKPHQQRRKPSNTQAQAVAREMRKGTNQDKRRGRKELRLRHKQNTGF